MRIRLLLELGSRSAGCHPFPVSCKAHGLPATVALARLGRMLDDGDVKLLGTDEGSETLRTITSPIESKCNVVRAHACQGSLVH